MQLLSLSIARYFETHEEYNSLSYGSSWRTFTHEGMHPKGFYHEHNTDIMPLPSRPNPRIEKSRFVLHPANLFLLLLSIDCSHRHVFSLWIYCMNYTIATAVHVIKSLSYLNRTSIPFRPVELHLNRDFGAASVDSDTQTRYWMTLPHLPAHVPRAASPSQLKNSKLLLHACPPTNSNTTKLRSRSVSIQPTSM